MLTFFISGKVVILEFKWPLEIVGKLKGKICHFQVHFAVPPEKPTYRAENDRYFELIPVKLIVNLATYLVKLMKKFASTLMNTDFRRTY